MGKYRIAPGDESLYKKINITVRLDAWKDARNKGKNISKHCSDELVREMHNNVWTREKIQKNIEDAETDISSNRAKLAQIEAEENESIQKKLCPNLEKAVTHIITRNIFPSTEGQWWRNAKAWGVDPGALMDEVNRRRKSVGRDENRAGHSHINCPPEESLMPALKDNTPNLCKNCGHPIVEHALDKGRWEHGSACAISEIECYTGDCDCKTPEPDIEKVGT